MKGAQAEQKLFILTVHYGTWQRRLFLAGPANARGEAKFAELRQQVSVIAEGADGPINFNQQVVDLFAREGFHLCDG